MPIMYRSTVQGGLSSGWSGRLAEAEISSLDEAATFWLQNDRPFALDAMVDMLVELLITLLRCASQLDPNIDAIPAIAVLRTP